MELDNLIINEEAEDADTLFLNDEIELEKIYKNIFRIKGQDVILKTFCSLRHFYREKNRLKTLSDVEGVSKMLKYSEKGNIKFLLLREEKGTDLCTFGINNGLLSEEMLKEITTKTLHILKNIHKKGVIHGDIKPENIMYDPITKNLCIIDFEGKQTSDYSSPEQRGNNPITEKTDLWSLGVSLYYLYCGRFPPRKGLLRFPEKFRKEFREFLGWLIEESTDLRYSAEEALKDPWLST